MSNKFGQEWTIIEKLGYEHTVSTKFGNGMESNYTYNTQHECLQEVMLISSGNTVMQNKNK